MALQNLEVDISKVAKHVKRRIIYTLLRSTGAQCIDVLVSAGAGRGLRDLDGKTALDLALTADRTECIHTLSVKSGDAEVRVVLEICSFRQDPTVLYMKVVIHKGELTVTGESLVFMVLLACLRPQNSSTYHLRIAIQPRTRTF